MCGGGSDYPQPSTEERGLQSAQTQLLQQQRDLIQQQVKQQNLLAPVLFKQSGIIPQYGANGEITGYTQGPPTPEQQAAQAQLAAITQQTAQSNQLFQDIVPGLQKQAKLQDLLQPIAFEQAGLTPQYDASGQIVGFTQDPMQATLKGQGQQIQQQLNQRTLDALAGNLPVDPGLERNLSQQEAQLHNSLFAQLGPGYATSTPGQQALTNFAQRADELRYGARTGQLTLGQQLSLAQGQDNQQATNNALANIFQTPSGVLSVAQAAGPYSSVANPYGSAGTTQASLGLISGAVNSPFATGGALGQLGQMYGNAAGQLAQQRAQEIGRASCRERV